MARGLFNNKKDILNRFTRSNSSPNPRPRRGELRSLRKKAPEPSDNGNRPCLSGGTERRPCLPWATFPYARQGRDPPGDRHGRAPAVRSSPRATRRAAEALVSREQSGAGPGRGQRGAAGAARGVQPRALKHRPRRLPELVPAAAGEQGSEAATQAAVLRPARLQTRGPQPRSLLTQASARRTERQRAGSDVSSPPGPLLRG